PSRPAPISGEGEQLVQKMGKLSINENEKTVTVANPLAASDSSSLNPEEQTYLSWAYTKAWNLVATILPNPAANTLTGTKTPRDLVDDALFEKTNNSEEGVSAEEDFHSIEEDKATSSPPTVEEKRKSFSGTSSPK